MASNLKRGAWVVAALLLGAANAAIGATVTANYTGHTGTGSYHVTFQPASGSPITKHVGAGKMNWTDQSGTLVGNVPSPKAFSTYCIDIAQTVSNGVFELTEDPDLVPNPQQASGNLSSGWAGLAGKSKVNALSQLFAKHFNLNGTVEHHSAFQLAVWEIVFESSATGNRTLAGGTLKVSESNPVVTKAQGFLDSLYVGTEYAVADFVFMRAPGTGATANNQDQIYYNPPAGGATPIPVPASVLGGGVLLAGLVTRRGTRSI